MRLNSLWARKSLVYQAFYVKIANEMLSYINTCTKERNTDIKWILASDELCSFICRGVLWGENPIKLKILFLLPPKISVDLYYRFIMRIGEE